jgi:kynurenine formamidase
LALFELIGFLLSDRLTTRNEDCEDCARSVPADKHAFPIARRAFVSMRTDWSKRWPDGAAMDNKDAAGVAHYPGWTMAALKYLYKDRKITASGHETTDTDLGVAASKEAGALVIVSFAKPKGGSGFPARVFAICPQ